MYNMWVNFCILYRFPLMMGSIWLAANQIHRLHHSSELKHQNRSTGIARFLHRVLNRNPDIHSVSEFFFSSFFFISHCSPRRLEYLRFLWVECDISLKRNLTVTDSQGNQHRSNQLLCPITYFGFHSFSQSSTAYLNSIRLRLPRQLV